MATGIQLIDEPAAREVMRALGFSEREREEELARRYEEPTTNRRAVSRRQEDDLPVPVFFLDWIDDE